MSNKSSPWIVALILFLAAIGVGGTVVLVVLALQVQKPGEQVEQAPLGPLETRGRALFQARGCNACHTVDGSAGIGPSMAGFWGRQRQLADGGQVTGDEAYFIESVRDPQAKVAAGFRPAMPEFGNSITDNDLAAIMAYVRTLPAQQSADKAH
ncbi:MAG: cytochrome c [Phycisphaerales bacterium]|nr:cytochrome c [Phycisphaerales bacterium]